MNSAIHFITGDLNPCNGWLRRLGYLLSITRTVMHSGFKMERSRKVLESENKSRVSAVYR